MTDVKFPFGDRTLEGEVVAERPDYRFNDPARTFLDVEVDGRLYRVLQRDAEPA